MDVEKIKEQPKRFSSAYIYKVAYNCLYCISHDIKRDRDRYENETSNIVSCGEDQLDLFDTVSENIDFDEELSKEAFWRTIENMGLPTNKVINYLLNGESLDKVSKRSKSYETDPLRDVSVSLDEMEAIINELRKQLAKFKGAF